MMMLDGLLISMRLKKRPVPKPDALVPPPRVVAGMHHAGSGVGHASRRMRMRPYAAPAVAPSPAPTPDTSNDLMNAVLLSSLLTSSTRHENDACPAPKPFRSGDGGDFGGGGASATWEAPAQSPSNDSGSSDSDSSSSSSSD